MNTGRVVVITGAGGGIGAKIVERFLENGDTVVGLDRSDSLLRNLEGRHDSERRLSTVTADITQIPQVAAFTTHMREKHGRVDVLINCAGYYPLVAFEKMTMAQWDEVLAINLTGSFHMVHALLPLMKGQGWGRIVNIGSASFFEGVPGQTHYVAAKAGLIGFTRSLAMEVGVYGITVNIVAPGLTLTAPVLSSMPEKLIKAQVEQRAIKRDERSADLAGPVFLLASPDANFVSGQMLVVDGGKVKN